MSVRRQNELMRVCCCLSVCWKSFPSKLTTFPWWEWLPCLFHWWLRFGERCHMKPHLVSVWAQQKHTFVAMLYCPRLIILWNCNGIVSVVFVAPRCLNGERQPWAPQCKTRIKQIKICSFFPTSLSFKISMLYKNLQYTLKLKKMWGREKGGGRLTESRCVYMLIIVANWPAKRRQVDFWNHHHHHIEANPPPKIKHIFLLFVLTIFLSFQLTSVVCIAIKYPLDVWYFHLKWYWLVLLLRLQMQLSCEHVHYTETLCWRYSILFCLMVVHNIIIWIWINVWVDV